MRTGIAAEMRVKGRHMPKTSMSNNQEPTNLRTYLIAQDPCRRRASHWNAVVVGIRTIRKTPAQAVESGEERKLATSAETNHAREFAMIHAK
jgi:hypothetical protein